ncbi:MAG: hypothetical protein IPM40_00275 [Gammaproteobacteria bacterium]|nr:hypothetical protein [Gammaproteobacteria bacterium]
MITFFPPPLLIPLLPPHYFLLLAEDWLCPAGTVITEFSRRSTSARSARVEIPEYAEARTKASPRKPAHRGFLSPMVSMPRKLQMARQYGVPGNPVMAGSTAGSIHCAEQQLSALPPY